MTLKPAHRGLWAMILAYAIWGLFPVYWKALSTIPAHELLLVRLILTAAVCLALMPLRGSWNAFKSALRRPATLRLQILAALLLSGNWFSFIWAVGSGRVLESSLGYFLCPLVNVLLGRFVEKEEMGRLRGAAVVCAGSGVGIMILLAGRVPVAALAIAFTWGGYTLLKKRSALGPVVSLGLETSLLSPVAAALLVLLSLQAPLSLGSAGGPVYGLLAMAGILTALPLLLFAYGAQRLRLGTMGMGQFIVPSAHFGLAVLYGERVNLQVLGAFALIWTGLVLYTLGGRRKTGLNSR